MSRGHRVNLTLDDQLLDALTVKAATDGRPLADAARELLREALGLGEPEPTTVGGLAEKLILEGLPNAVVLQRVKLAFPDANTSGKAIAWYRAKLNREAKAGGPPVLSEMEARHRHRGQA